MCYLLNVSSTILKNSFTKEGNCMNLSKHDLRPSAHKYILTHQMIPMASGSPVDLFIFFYFNLYPDFYKVITKYCNGKLERLYNMCLIAQKICLYT